MTLAIMDILDQPSDELASHQRFASFNFIEQPGKMGLCLGGLTFAHGKHFQLAVLTGRSADDKDASMSNFMPIPNTGPRVSHGPSAR